MPSLAPRPRGSAPSDDVPEVDDLDRSIIAALQRDGRATYRAIARELEVPEATVRFRAGRLQRSGVMSVTAFAHPERLGYGVLASVLLRVAAPRRAAVVEELRGWGEVMYLSSCAGRADLLLQIVCRTLAELNDVTTVRLAGLDGMLEVEVLLELDVHKAHYEFLS